MLPGQLELCRAFALNLFEWQQNAKTPPQTLKFKNVTAGIRKRACSPQAQTGGHYFAPFLQL